MPFQASAFPYDGPIPNQDRPFLDVIGPDGRRGHSSGRSRTYWLDETYSDRNVLIGIPSGLRLDRPVLFVVYFHGNGAILQRDVLERQQIFAQVEGSRLNAILLSPQMAFDAQDSSAGNFWRAGQMQAFLSEAAEHVAWMLGQPHAVHALKSAPFIIAAYSGGYNPAAYVLSDRGGRARLKGVLLFDALYGEEDRFADWVMDHHSHAFFISLYTASSLIGNVSLEKRLRDAHVPLQRRWPAPPTPGTIAFHMAPEATNHNDVMTWAGIANPLQALLARLPGYAK